MLEVTVKKRKDEPIPIQKGDLVELFAYPENSIILVTDWTPDNDEPNSFAGVVLFNDSSLYDIGQYATHWNKLRIERFAGSITLKQS